MKKIKRALFWVQKALDIVGQKNVSTPDAILDDIRPVLEALGWTRLPETFHEVTNNPGSATVLGTVCPGGILRFVTAASCHHTDTVTDHSPWVEKQTNADRVAPSTFAVGLCAASPILPANVKNGIVRPTFLVEGDVLQGKTESAVGGGFSVVLQASYLDLPIGEYVPPL